MDCNRRVASPSLGYWDLSMQLLLIQLRARKGLVEGGRERGEGLRSGHGCCYCCSVYVWLRSAKGLETRTRTSSGGPHTAQQVSPLLTADLRPGPGLLMLRP